MLPCCGIQSCGMSFQPANGVVCGDHQSMCQDGQTCCKLASGGYACCPLPKVSCSFKIPCYHLPIIKLILKNLRSQYMSIFTFFLLDRRSAVMTTCIAAQRGQPARSALGSVSVAILSCQCMPRHPLLPW